MKMSKLERIQLAWDLAESIGAALDEVNQTGKNRISDNESATIQVAMNDEEVADFRQSLETIFNK